MKRITDFFGAGAGKKPTAAKENVPDASFAPLSSQETASQQTSQCYGSTAKGTGAAKASQPAGNGAGKKKSLGARKPRAKEAANGAAAPPPMSQFFKPRSQVIAEAEAAKAEAMMTQEEAQQYIPSVDAEDPAATPETGTNEPFPMRASARYGTMCLRFGQYRIPRCLHL